MVYEPPLYPTSIPTEADLVIAYDDISWSTAALHNNYNKEIRTLMIELGLLPKGSYATVRARLDDLQARIEALEV